MCTGFEGSGVLGAVASRDRLHELVKVTYVDSPLQRSFRSDRTLPIRSDTDAARLHWGASHCNAITRLCKRVDCCSRWSIKNPTPLWKSAGTE